MQIFAKSICGEVIEIDITKTDKIIDLKKKIEDLIGLLSYEQKLVFQARILEDDKTVHFYRISEKSVINVIDRYRNGMQIFVKTMDGKKIEIEITKIETIFDVKKKIQKKISLSSDSLMLMYDDVVLDDDDLVEYYHISEKSVIIAMTREVLQINVKVITGELIHLQATKSDTIIGLKRKIQIITGIHFSKQKLSYKDIGLCNAMTICDYQIATNSTVNMLSSDAGANKRGICLVISNESFTTHYPRHTGAEKDERRIIDTFEPLGFKVKIHRDADWTSTHEAIIQTKEEIKIMDKILIVFILSYGNTYSFVTHDQRLFLFRDVCSPFANENLPKLFFFVCDQTKVDNDSLLSDRGSNEGDNIDKLSTMVNVFLAYSATNNYRSSRNTDHGSNYINCLCDVITKKPNWSIADVHQEVQRRLSIKSFLNDGLQMPYATNNLRSHAYFITDGH